MFRLEPTYPLLPETRYIRNSIPHISYLHNSISALSPRKPTKQHNAPYLPLSPSLGAWLCEVTVLQFRLEERTWKIQKNNKCWLKMDKLAAIADSILNKEHKVVSDSQRGLLSRKNSFCKYYLYWFYGGLNSSP